MVNFKTFDMFFVVAIYCQKKDNVFRLSKILKLRKSIVSRVNCIVVINLDLSLTKLDKLDHSFSNMFNEIEY